MRMRPRLMIAALAGLLLGTPCLAQTGPADCNPAGRAEAATPPARGSGDGTAPGNAGSTGWTGGTGGSLIGTNPSGATAASRTWQPPTARGLDPLAARPARAC